MEGEALRADRFAGPEHRGHLGLHRGVGTGHDLADAIGGGHRSLQLEAQSQAEKFVFVSRARTCPDRVTAPAPAGNFPLRQNMALAPSATSSGMAAAVKSWLELQCKRISSPPMTGPRIDPSRPMPSAQPIPVERTEVR